MYVHRGSFSQRGRGLGNIFGSLMRAVVPIGKSIFKSPITKSILRTVRDTALEGGVSMASDALRGRDVGESFQDSLGTAKNRLADSLESGLAQHNRPAVKRKGRGRRGGTKKRRRQSNLDLLS